MDFMNLNQSAHGDREFGYIAAPACGYAARSSSGTVRTPARASGSRLVPCCLPAGTTAQNLRVARFGDNMRDVAVTEGDRVEAQRTFGCLGQQLRHQRPRRRRRAAPDEASRRARRANTTSSYDVAPELRSGGDRRTSLRDAARIEAGLGAFWTTDGFDAFTTTSRTWAR